MEAKFSKKAIMLFALLALVMLLSISMWFYSRLIFVQYKTYYIHCTGSVSGLYEGSFVSYKGLHVGKIVKLDIDPNRNNNITITAKIDRSLKIKEDTKASLIMKGITGYMNLDLSGGLSTSAQLQGNVIAYQESTIDQMFNSVPVLMDDCKVLLKKCNDVVNVIKHTSNRIIAIGESTQNTVERKITPILHGLDKIVSVVNEQGVIGLIRCEL